MKKNVVRIVSSCFLISGMVLFNSCKKDPVIPTLTTTDITNITVTSLMSGGSITKDGGATVTERGVCYGTSSGPLASGNHTTDDSGVGSFVSNVTGLTPNTLYYIRAYATNSAGTAYGNEITATTTPIVVPTLTTVDVSSITLTSAISGGNITADGNDAITARGVCWATTTGPTIANDKTTDGTGVGSFISNLTGLQSGVTYYLRAYATNSAGTAYGNEISFNTAAVTVPTLLTASVTSITLTSAVSGGIIATDGGGSVTARGICWNTVTGPTLANSTTSNGTGTGSFVSNLTGLTAGTTYYIRAYATNSAGTAYGNEVSFASGLVVIPTITTTAVSSITQTSATLGGNVLSSGGGTVTGRGVCWSTAINPTISSSLTSDGTAEGSFVSSLTGLLPGTVYHVRAYAVNGAGTAYGNEVVFTTNPLLIPTLTTTVVTSITLTTASSGGNISADGGSAVTSRGICYATTPAPTTANSKTTDGTGTGSFTSNLTGLLPGTVYHLRAYAVNAIGTAYGTDVQFTTVAVVAPSLTTAAVTAIDLTTATSGGTITSDGGGAISAKGVCWATTTTPTTADSKTTDGTGTASFVSNLISLSTGTNYYVRAYATNSAGTTYGNQVSFNTKIADVDGNTYNTVLIGTQVWMAENLKTTKYNDNTGIPLITADGAWAATTTDAYCWYANVETTNKPLYGAIYNWFAVNTGKLCPVGWHVPSDAEYMTLELYLGMAPGSAPGQVENWDWRGTDQGSKMKNTTGWATGMNGTNTSGWSALPGGYRYGGSGVFNNVGDLSFWWASDGFGDNITGTGIYRRLDGSNNGVWRAGVLKQAGKYVRCVKD